mmetsp:Transcript_5172/g.18499  ORF Transcript_5172/g.18499 Transcript_5172/m.18499 type:complete len:228 (+) Transcript_5172:120-803(+)
MEGQGKEDSLPARPQSHHLREVAGQARAALPQVQGEAGAALASLLLGEHQYEPGRCCELAAPARGGGGSQRHGRERDEVQEQLSGFSQPRDPQALQLRALPPMYRASLSPSGRQHPLPGPLLRLLSRPPHRRQPGIRARSESQGAEGREQRAAAHPAAGLHRRSPRGAEASRGPVHLRRDGSRTRDALHSRAGGGAEELGAAGGERSMQKQGGQAAVLQQGGVLPAD